MKVCFKCHIMYVFLLFSCAEECITKARKLYLKDTMVLALFKGIGFFKLAKGTKHRYLKDKWHRPPISNLILDSAQFVDSDRYHALQNLGYKTIV